MRVRRPPHLLQIVEGADFRTEDMNDHVARIDQYPIAMRHALDPGVAQTRLREILEDAIGDSAYMALRPTGGHNHAVRKSGFQGEIDGHGVLGLHVIEAREDQAKNLLGGRTQLGDVFGSAASAKPSDFRCWQGSFPFESVIAPARKQERL